MSTPIKLPREELAKALAECKWNKSEAAKRLGIHRATLRKLITKYRLNPPWENQPDSAEPVTVLVPEELTIEEEHRLKVEVRNLRKRLQEILDANLREENMRSMFLTCAELDLTPPKWLAPPRKRAEERGIVTALLSDCHFDEVVNPAEFNWRNGYDREIAGMRLERYFQNVIKVSRDYINGIKVEQIVLPLLGDMLSGNIHEELRQTNDAPILDSLLYWSERLAAGIEMLLGHFSEIYVPCVVGNHGRLDKKPRYKLRVKENYDWLLYHILAKHFRNIEEVTFSIPESADFSYEVYRTRYLITHGDQFPGGSGIAGILTPVFLGDHRKTRRNMALDMPYDHMLCGHFHQQRDLASVILNGTLKGYDEYAFMHNFPFELPRQAYWLTDPDYGKTIFVNIRVMDERESWRVKEHVRP